MSTVQTTVRSILQTPVIDYHIDKQFNKLRRAYSKINKCKVVIDLSKNKTHKYKMFSVRISLISTGKELSSKKQNPNLFLAIRDCFAAVEQLLEKHHKKQFSLNKIYARCLNDYKNKSPNSHELLKTQ